MFRVFPDQPRVVLSAQVTRKVIRKFVSADGVEREEVMLEGPRQEAVAVDEADGFSKVVKRTVVKSGGDQTEVGILCSVQSQADTCSCTSTALVIW